MSGNLAALANSRRFFESGATKPYAFRKQQLERLRTAIRNREQAIQDALYADLKKSPEEAWITETGFVLAEIRHTLNHLQKWMKPERVGTNLLNLPSRSFIYREPLGLVLIIAPWNYPFQLLLAPLVGALAAGNCVVLKPSEFAPATAAILRAIITEVFPPEQVLLVEGDGATVVPDLMKHFRFNHVFYTGSTAVGRSIYQLAADQLVPVTLELGGKSPCVVTQHANLHVAAKRIAVTKFSNAGQMCVAPDYLLVHRSVKEELVQELKRVIVAFFDEDPSNSYHFGKIINARHFQRLRRFLDEGTILHGGRNSEDKLYIEPTLVGDIAPDMAVMGEEIFGPVLPILAYETKEEALALIRRNPDPLAFYLFTNNKEEERWWIDALPFGGGCINNASWHLTNFNLPFGGRGNSGIGAYHGKFSFDLFSHAKSVMKTPTWFDPKMKYPPFKGKLGLFKKILR